jgi:hypothetical protein
MLLVATLAAAACAAPSPKPDAHWRKTTPDAAPLDEARAACRAHAIERSSRSANQSIAAKAAAGAFAECMRERGWALVDQE